MRKFTAIASYSPLRLHAPVSENHKLSIDYYAPDGLHEAIESAMVLGVPLLLTGEPGTGKTQAAYWLARELSKEATPSDEILAPLRFNVKSTSTGFDLLYSFDDVGRFRDKEERPLVRHLRFNPLGEGILRAAGGDSVLQTISGTTLQGSALAQHRDLLVKAFGPTWQPHQDAARASDLLPDDTNFSQQPPTVRIVLIDELDKAPRDTPNDLLAEVEDMTFTIPELGLRVTAGLDARPIIIITSNSEKVLPDAFLRRCAYFNVPFPDDDEKLKMIVRGRVDALKGGGTLIDDALSVLRALRTDTSGLNRRPATSELLAWLEILVRLGGLAPGDSLRRWAQQNPKIMNSTLAVLLKDQHDRVLGVRIIADWAARDAT